MCAGQASAPCGARAAAPARLRVARGGPCGVRARRAGRGGGRGRADAARRARRRPERARRRRERVQCGAAQGAARGSWPARPSTRPTCSRHSWSRTGSRSRSRGICAADASREQEVPSVAGSGSGGPPHRAPPSSRPRSGSRRVHVRAERRRRHGGAQPEGAIALGRRVGGWERLVRHARARSTLKGEGQHQRTKSAVLPDPP